MNRKPGYGAKLRANLEPTKGVGRLRQQDGGHGTRDLHPAVGASARPRRVGGRGGSLQNLGREPGRSGRRLRILVVVANIQMRTLKAEEGKGSM
ncbi:hypothetical protein L2E82_50671 [Cichorium intybus]|nr:hypothetical protein L2E82_50671 [Cichorium intybus]